MTAVETRARIYEDLFIQAALRPDAAAVEQGSKILTFDDVARASLALAQQLRDRGVQEGDRIGVLFDKELRSVIALYGCWTAGAVPVPIHHGLKGHQVKHIVDHSEAKVVLADPRLSARFGPAVFGAAEVATVLDNPPTGPSSYAEHGAVNPAGRVAPPPGASALAIILYTSGSTGLPKGIALSHDNLLAGARIISTYLELRDDERILSLTPFSFDYGLNQLLDTMRTGSTLVLQRSLLPSDICRTLEEKQVTGLPAVPPLFVQLMDRASPLSSMKLPHLRFITNTGGVFPPDLVRQYRATFPHARIYLMYGLTEAFRSTYLHPSQTDIRPDSIGKAIPETDILLLDEEGRLCAEGVPGELVHRGPTVALGYWRDPEATAARFVPDPLADDDVPIDQRRRVVFSGDLVRRDAEGYLYFVSRRDLMIKSQGFRISPDEVESVLMRSPLVLEAVATGEPHPVAGAQVLAHVVPRDPEGFSVSALLAWCQIEMPRYMVPGRIVVHAAFPRTTTGKIDKKAVCT